MGESSPCRGRSKCKGPEGEIMLVSSRKRGWNGASQGRAKEMRSEGMPGVGWRGWGTDCVDPCT